MNRKMWIVMGCLLLTVMIALTATLISGIGRHRITVISGEKFVYQCPGYAKAGETVTVMTSVVSDAELYVNGVEGEFARPGEFRFVMPDHDVELKVTVSAFPTGA